MWKHQLPSIFCRHQPTGGFYLSQLQLTSIKLQLDMEAPTSSLFQKKNTCWFTWISALFCSFFTVVQQPSYLPYIISESSQHLYLLLLLLTLSASFLHSLTSRYAYLCDIIYRVHLMTVCIPLGIRNGQPCLFAFCLLISFQLTQKNVTVGVFFFNITVGYLLSSGDLPMHHNNINLNKTFTFKFKWEHQLTHFVSWLAAHLYFLWLCLFLFCSLYAFLFMAAA